MAPCTGLGYPHEGPAVVTTVLLTTRERKNPPSYMLGLQNRDVSKSELYQDKVPQPRDWPARA